MYNIKINISELKNVVSKLNLAIEKTKINPKAGWIELETISDTKLSLKVANYDYYLGAIINSTCPDFDSNNRFHATISADTFIPLVSKLDDDYVYLSENYNSIVFTSASNEYTFPTIKELGRVKCIDEIKFDCTDYNEFICKGAEMASIAESNAKGLVDSIVSQEIQQFIYVDPFGAITFTENIYINSFEYDESGKDLEKLELDKSTKFLLNCTQAKLLKVFEDFTNLKVSVELNSGESSKKIQIIGEDADYTITLVLVAQCDDLTNKFPVLKLRAISEKVNKVHVILDKKVLEKALSRLMVFDKKFDITVLDYSKLIFKNNEVKLVSIKNKNYELISYIKSENTFEYEVIIRFADLQAQLKAIKAKEIDISYGESAIAINSGNLKQLIPEIKLATI